MRGWLGSLVISAPLALPACGGPAVPGTAAVETHTPRAARDALDRRWQQQAAELLVDPRRVVLPFSDQGVFLAHEARGRAYVFAAIEGQTVDIRLARAAVIERTYDDGPILIDLYRVVWHGATRRLVRVDGIGLEPGRLSVRLPRTADYVLRLQPDVLVNAYFGLQLELSAALEFPIEGRDLEAVRSFFGDDREGGKRLHEGVDIFAPRSTPIVAVADGRAVPKQEGAGGTVVYLNTAGVSYYYAHLERTTMDRPRRVRAGEVLGFVGNSGNAERMAPHLHFGIYDWGRGAGAVDPMPYLTARRFDEAPDAALPALVARRTLVGDQLAPSSRAAIVWMPAAPEVPALAPSAGTPLRMPAPLGPIDGLALAARVEGVDAITSIGAISSSDVVASSDVVTLSDATLRAGLPLPLVLPLM